METKLDMGVDPELKPPPPALYAASAADSPPGSMNYSPKHLRKPNLLSSSRNINMKHLLLNLSPSPAVNTLPPRRGKLLALAIPPQASPSLAHHTISTPIADTLAMARLLAATASLTPAGAVYDGLLRAHTLPLSGADSDTETPLRDPFSARAASLRSPFGSGLVARMAGVALDDYADKSSSSDSQIDLDFDFANLKSDNTKIKDNGITSSDNSADPRQGDNGHAYQGILKSSIMGDTVPYAYVPEELQESTNEYAYPNGPANVLNSILFLYSDPLAVSDFDLSSYDLVVNVARECEDKSLEVANYLYIPWSHTSPILAELPRITAEIARYDRPGNKILVHCQCGVLRSACVVVAYFMVKFDISVNEAYELLKSGTSNRLEPCSRRISDAGNTVDACERICPNMSLIFELMDFGERLKSAGKSAA